MTKTREQRIADGEIVPNSFQHPNIYEDWLAYYLRPQEHVVLGKAVREIMGFEKKIVDRRARIALSIFVDGKTSTKTGDLVCLGCGLSLQAIRTALMGLDRYGILCKEGRPTSEGQQFYLQDDASKIDWDGLARRRERWDEKNVRRTRKAIAASLESRGITYDSTPNVARYPNPLGTAEDEPQIMASTKKAEAMSDIAVDPMSDINKETQGETQKDIYTDSTLWPRALADLALQMDPAAFDLNLRGTTATVAHDNGAVLVTVHARSHRSAAILDARQRGTVERVLAGLADGPVAVTFEGEA